MRPYPPLEWGSSILATSTRAPATAADRLKWSFFALMGLGVLLVLWTDERFWINPADPHWKHIAPVKWLLPIHGLAGVTALVAGALQMSSRIRRDAHRAPPRARQGLYLRRLHLRADRRLHRHRPARAGHHPCRAIFPGRAVAGERARRLGLHPQRPDGAAQAVDDAQLRLHPDLRPQPRAGRIHRLLHRPVPVDMLWSLVVVAVIAPEVILTARASPHPQGEGQARPDRSSLSDRR